VRARLLQVGRPEGGISGPPVALTAKALFGIYGMMRDFPAARARKRHAAAACARKTDPGDDPLVIPGSPQDIFRCGGEAVICSRSPAWHEAPVCHADRECHLADLLPEAGQIVERGTPALTLLGIMVARSLRQVAFVAPGHPELAVRIAEGGTRGGDRSGALVHVRPALRRR
jgi:hypothetical protein